MGFESRLKQKEDIVDEAQRENGFSRGFHYYLEESYLVYKCKRYFFRKNNSNRKTSWRASCTRNLTANSDLKAIPNNAQGLLPIVKDNGRMNVEFNGNYFVQNKVLHLNNNTVVNICIVYRLDKISNTRNIDYTIQNALFGAVKITKNTTNTSKTKHEGYGLCFDEGGTFAKGSFTNGKNVIIFGAKMSFSTHTTNKANNIYVLSDFLVQGISGTTIYVEQVYKTKFTEAEKEFVLSLHYNGNESYLFANGVQQLKFKADDSQILNAKLCLGNLSSNWTSANSTNTGLYGKVYDFVVDYEPINGVKKIYDMHRYLMTKHGI